MCPAAAVVSCRELCQSLQASSMLAAHCRQQALMRHTQNQTLRQTQLTVAALDVHASVRLPTASVYELNSKSTSSREHCIIESEALLELYGKSCSLARYWMVLRLATLWSSSAP
jgi:hypothetical protein